jgi:hypothetical protein
LSAKVNLPKYVRPRQLAGGKWAYFWEPPTWARNETEHICPVTAEALGGDLVKALNRAAELNLAFDDWRALRRTRQEGDIDAIAGPPYGTLDWLVTQFEKDSRFPTNAKTARGYDQGLALVCGYTLKSGRRLGAVQAASIEERHADAVYETLQWVSDPKAPEGQRNRLATANAAMRAARRLYNVAVRRKWSGITNNPFARMELRGTGGTTVPPTRAQVEAFCAKADEMGSPSMSLAAMLAFELCQREGDVIGTMAWTHYDGQRIYIRQAKTDELVWAPLFDEEGELFPGLTDRLDAAPRRGSLIIMRDAPDKRASKAAGYDVYLPYKEDWFRHLFRKIADAAGIPKEIKFMSFRHGGLTELGDAEATDQEMMSMSGHTDPKTLRIYSKRSGIQARNAARKRRVLRTK